MEEYLSPKGSFIALLVIACLLIVSPLKADDTSLPNSVAAQMGDQITKIGTGIFRKFGFRIYEATLWSTQREWDAGKPFALQLCYARDLSKETLVDTVIDDIAEQGVANEKAITEWKSVLESALTDIKEGDVLTGLSIPGQKTLLFHNGTQIVAVEDKNFSDAFFNVWLGKNADKELKQKLLGGT